MECKAKKWSIKPSISFCCLAARNFTLITSPIIFFGARKIVLRDSKSDAWEIESFTEDEWAWSCRLGLSGHFMREFDVNYIVQQEKLFEFEFLAKFLQNFVFYKFKLKNKSN